MSHETMNDLPENVRSQVSDLLNNRLAEAIDLQTQVKQAHWNVKGPQFIALHKLFDEINDAVVEYVDLLAERVVQLGGTAEGTARAVAERSEPPEHPLTISTGQGDERALSSPQSNFGESIRPAFDQTAALCRVLPCGGLSEYSRRIGRARGRPRAWRARAPDRRGARRRRAVASGSGRQGASRRTRRAGCCRARRPPRWRRGTPRRAAPAPSRRRSRASGWTTGSAPPWCPGARGAPFRARPPTRSGRAPRAGPRSRPSRGRRSPRAPWCAAPSRARRSSRRHGCAAARRTARPARSRPGAAVPSNWGRSAGRSTPVAGPRRSRRCASAWPGTRPPRARCRSTPPARSEEHTSELQSPCNLVCRLLLE